MENSRALTGHISDRAFNLLEAVCEHALDVVVIGTLSLMAIVPAVESCRARSIINGPKTHQICMAPQPSVQTPYIPQSAYSVASTNNYSR